MSVRADAIEVVRIWFESLGAAYLGPILPDLPLFKPPAVAGWRVKLQQKEVVFIIDEAFPYTRINAHILPVDGKLRFPHIEANGRLCLDNFIAPTNPVAAANSTLLAASNLIKENLVGKHLDDFAEDFGLYWTNSIKDHNGDCLVLRVSNSANGYAHYFSRDKQFYVSDSDIALSAWMGNLYGNVAQKIHQAVILEITPLPSPSLFPDTGTALWKLVKERSDDGLTLLSKLLRSAPKNLLVLLSGTAPSGRKHTVGIQLTNPPPSSGNRRHRDKLTDGFRKNNVRPDVLICRYQLRRLTSKYFDRASARLPEDQNPKNLSEKKVMVVGCGAIGSGVCEILAKAGVGTLALVDHDVLNWENIRRHSLGSNFVGKNKAESMATRLRQQVPDIKEIKPYKCTIENLMIQKPNEIMGIDLIISCTASWGADCAIDDFTHRGKSNVVPVVYGWMEANGIAAHAVMVSESDTIKSGFDEGGNFRIRAASDGKPAPAECGNTTSVFGAIELATSQSLIARLAVDTLNGHQRNSIWRTWVTDAQSLQRAEARWSKEWQERYGTPPNSGGFFETEWPHVQ